MYLDQETNICIIGGGIAGLAAATMLARAGQSVILFEKSHSLGGRAGTQERNGFLLNQGPHALYAGGYGIKLLRELRVAFSGGKPKANGLAVLEDRIEELPATPLSLFRSGLISQFAKIELGYILTQIPKTDPGPFQYRTVRQWVEALTNNKISRKFLYALTRVFTYTNAIDDMSAGAAIKQWKLALKQNVYYLDGGWQTLIDQLADAAQAAGTHIITHSQVVEIAHEDAVHGVCLKDGTFYPADTILVAASPKSVINMVQKSHQHTLASWCQEPVPVRAACLDVGLKQLPKPKNTFAVGLDRPLYLSVHSATAKLAPKGYSLIHTAKYLPTTATDPQANREELETLLDRIQPGWREQVITTRFLPQMTVSHAMVTAKQGGIAGRPESIVPGIRGLYAIGDWIGATGMLVDASLATAKEVVTYILDADFAQKSNKIVGKAA